MDKKQQSEFLAYIEEAREITQTDVTFREDYGIIRDFIEAFGDNLSWENIERLCANRRVARADKDKVRRIMYRWKAHKEGDTVAEILENYTGLGTRACEVIGCPSRDIHGFCEKRYRYRASCSTLKELDDLKKWGPIALRTQGRKKEPEMIDWIFGYTCSYKGSSSAIFKEKI